MPPMDQGQMPPMPPMDQGAMPPMGPMPPMDQGPAVAAPPTYGMLLEKSSKRIKKHHVKTRRHRRHHHLHHHGHRAYRKYLTPLVFGQHSNILEKAARESYVRRYAKEHWRKITQRPPKDAKGSKKGSGRKTKTRSGGKRRSGSKTRPAVKKKSR